MNDTPLSDHSPANTPPAPADDQSPPPPPPAPADEEAATTDADNATTKKTSKKSSKKTAKKSDSKKTAKKKTAKKPAAKKSTKKKTAKKSSKKTAKKSGAKADDAPEDSDADTQDTPTAPDASPDAQGEAAPDDAPEQPESSDDKGSQKKTSRKTSKKSSQQGRSSSRRSRRDTAAIESADPAPPARGEDPTAEMIVNYVPGEECRIAIVEDGQLDEFYSEPTNQVSRVGNIYVGRVTNVETAIQAAFVDFGLPENGFLHVSDIHPRYFPSGSDTEQVGKKTPRRERPPIQKCLRKGQEITVQVLKEGVGTKGPSLTSYLSVPGRYLVMMPDMDSLGVSRKEDDEDRRRQAKKILSTLDLPDGFGFILRTAGFDRTKTELKRDLAYLQRLWGDMEKRRKQGGNKPRLLYSESDLLLRSLRDLVGSHIKRVVIDDEHALERAARFLKIVSPRSQAKLASYDDPRPVFYAFGLEEQIKMINATEVPLPSGGRLIIEQTEALVAIDVNSGKSRGAKDAETNAYKTNLEAADAICRQLKLRDLGGLVINDLIDMRLAKHRKAIEQRFLDNLKKDRAKSTILPISEFGILEMTRQRMRGSQESLNFAECATCKGRGLVQRPDSVAAQALRDLADVLVHDRVKSAELVVHPKVAGALLSTRRPSLTRVELRSGKKVDVRVSDTLPIDRVTVYAYDEHGNDIAPEKLRPSKAAPTVTPYDHGDLPADDDDGFAADLKSEAESQSTAALAEQLLSAARHAPDDTIIEIGESDDDTGAKKKRRKRRRGGRGRSKQDAHESEHTEEPQQKKSDDPDQPKDKPDAPASDRDDEHEDSDDAPKKKRRRRRRGGRGRKKSDAQDSDRGEDRDHAPREDSGKSKEPASPAGDRDDEHEDSDDSDDAPKKKRRRRRGRRSNDDDQGRAPSDRAQDNPPSDNTPSDNNKPDSTAETKPASAKKKRRSLYSAGRRRLSPAELDRPQD
ncbi:MAG: Rne/Rng family ribonuclease [Phycisphaerales bacterium JB040]